MQLLYTTHNSLLGLHTLSPIVSWLIVIGALWSLVGLVRSIIRGVVAAAAAGGSLRHPPVDQQPRR